MSGGKCPGGKCLGGYMSGGRGGGGAFVLEPVCDTSWGSCSRDDDTFSKLCLLKHRCTPCSYLL